MGAGIPPDGTGACAQTGLVHALRQDWRMRARLAVCHVGRRTADRERRVTQGREPLVGEGREFG